MFGLNYTCMRGVRRLVLALGSGGVWEGGGELLVDVLEWLSFGVL